MSETPNRSPDALARRYLFKIVANVVAAATAVAITAVVPRTLGPQAFGTFSFLTSFFQRVTGFLSGGTSSCYYVMISRRPDETSIVRFYGGLVLFGGLLLLLCTAVIWSADLNNWIWPDQEMSFVWLAAIWGLLTWYGRVMQQTVDAYGLTVLGEVRLIIQRVLGLVLLLGLYWFGWLDLQRFFLYHYLILAFVIAAWFQVLRSNGVGVAAPLQRGDMKSYGAEFYSYSAPLLFFGLVALIGGYLDRWLLQKFAGPVEQGLFGLAYQIGAVSILLTGAMTPLLMREFAKLHESKDIERMRAVFMRYVPMFYLGTAIIAGFLAIHADRVSYLIGGDQYLGASTAVALMALYPVHQTYGQLSGSIFYATGQTALYRNLGLISVSLGIIVSLWLLAAAKYGGLDMKATGLAAKMLVMQVFTVNLQLWFNAKYLKLPLRRLVAHQAIVLAAALFLAWLVGAVADPLIGVGNVALLGNGILYLLICAGLVYLFPSSIFSSRTELGAVTQRLLSADYTFMRRGKH